MCVAIWQHCERISLAYHTASQRSGLNSAACKVDMDVGKRAVLRLQVLCLTLVAGSSLGTTGMSA